MQKQGFTLIELLVVIAIIGLLATMSVVSFSTARDKARIASGLSVSSQTLRTLGDEAIGVFNMDDCNGTNVNDTSGKNNNATIGGTATWTTDTPSGQGCALTFAGAGYVQTPVTSLVGNNFTISAWFKTTAAGSYPIVISNSTNHPIHLSAGHMRICVTACPIGTKTFNDGKWHLAVVVGDTKSVRMYMDGSNIPDTTQAASTGLLTGTMLIGSLNTAFTYAWTGSIDEVRFYDRALTANEAHQLYVNKLEQNELAKK